MTRELQSSERMEGTQLSKWLQGTKVRGDVTLLKRCDRCVMTGELQSSDRMEGAQLPKWLQGTKVRGARGCVTWLKCCQCVNERYYAITCFKRRHRLPDKEKLCACPSCSFQVPASLREFVLLGKLPSREHSNTVRAHAGGGLTLGSSSSSSSASNTSRSEQQQGPQGGPSWAPA